MTAEHMLAQWWAKKQTMNSALYACEEAKQSIDGIKSGTGGNGSGGASDSLIHDRLERYEESLNRWQELFFEREDQLREIDRIVSKMLYLPTSEKELRKMQRMHSVMVRYYRDGVMSDSRIASEMGVSRETVHETRIKGISTLNSIIGGTL